MLEELKHAVWKYNLELPKYGLVVMTSGNISGRDPATGEMYVHVYGQR